MKKIIIIIIKEKKKKILLMMKKNMMIKMNLNMLKLNLNFYFMMKKVILQLLNVTLKQEEHIKLEYI
jgi:hypothetical protein